MVLQRSWRILLSEEKTKAALELSVINFEVAEEVFLPSELRGGPTLIQSRMIITFLE